MLKKIDKRLLKPIMIIIGVIVLLILGAVFINLLGKEKLDYTGIENKMIESARLYYKDNSIYLPQTNGNSTEVTLETLVSEEYMKKPEAYMNNKNLSCVGRVTAVKNNDSYNYYPYLNCGKDYETTYLSNEIKKKIVTSSDGVYKINEYTINSKGEKISATNYVYRGEQVNNYLLINKQKWRIVKIDGNGNIVIIYDDKDVNRELYSVWDDRYNSEKDAAYGINDYTVSRAKENLEKIYNSDFFSADIKSKFLSHSVCIGKRSENDSKNDGSIECNKVLSDQYLSLLPIYDYLNSSLDTKCKRLTDPECFNYNYLNTYNNIWWLVTAAKEKTYLVYKVSGQALSVSASASARLRMVAVLDGKTIASGGSGTQTDPYVLK